MFSFPLDQMVGGIKYEHTHRMVASVIGLLTLVLAIWLARAKISSWLTKLGVAAFVAVVIQGILGGLTVKFLLPRLAFFLARGPGSDIFFDHDHDRLCIIL